MTDIAAPQDQDETSQNLEEFSPSIDTVFNLFSIFFISTISLLLTLSLMAIKFSFSVFGQELYLLTFSIFFGGYLVVFVFVVIYYLVRFSNVIRAIYEKHERTIKIGVLIIVVLITAIIGSILSINEDTTMKVIGTAIIVFFVALLFIIIEPITAPIRQKVDNWVNRKKNN
jgi:hypothetical protein